MEQVAKVASALTVLTLVASLVLPLLTFAQINLPVDPTQATSQKICETTDTFQVCLTKIFAIVFRVLIFVAGGLAVVFFIIAGILYITGGSNQETRDRSKSMLIWGAIGLVVALIAYAVVKLLQNIVNVGGLGM